MDEVDDLEFDSDLESGLHIIRYLHDMRSSIKYNRNISKIDERIIEQLKITAVELYRNLDKANDDNDFVQMEMCNNRILEFFDENNNAPLLFKEKQPLSLFLQIIQNGKNLSCVCQTLMILSKLINYSTEIAELLIDMDIKSVLLGTVEIDQPDQVHQLGLKCLREIAFSSGYGWRVIFEDYGKSPLQMVFNLHNAIFRKNDPIPSSHETIKNIFLFFQSLFNDERTGSQPDLLQEILRIVFPKNDCVSKDILEICLSICAIASDDFFIFFQSIYQEYLGARMFVNLLTINEFQPSDDPDIMEQQQVDSAIRCNVLVSLFNLIKYNRENDKFQNELFRAGLFEKLSLMLNFNFRNESLYCLDILLFYARNPKYYDVFIDEIIFSSIFYVLKTGAFDAKMSAFRVLVTVINTEDDSASELPSKRISFILDRFPYTFALLVENLQVFPFEQLDDVFEAMTNLLEFNVKIGNISQFMQSFDLSELQVSIDELKDEMDENKTTLSFKSNLQTLENLLKKIFF